VRRKEPDIFQKARERAELKGKILSLVSGLDAKTASELLAEVFVAVAERSLAELQASFPDVGSAPNPATRVRRAWPVKTKKERVLELLRGQPHLAVSALSQAVYGSEAAKFMKKTRNLLWELKRDQLIRNPEPGKWEVVG
jgi:hypothetical protein